VWPKAENSHRAIGSPGGKPFLLQPCIWCLLAGLLAVAHQCCDFDRGMRPEFALVVQEMSVAIAEMQQQVG